MNKPLLPDPAVALLEGAAACAAFLVAVSNAAGFIGNFAVGRVR